MGVLRAFTIEASRWKHTARLAVQWITRNTGYTAEQLAAGLQVGLGAFVLMAALSPPPVWGALSLEPADISPVYALVTFCVVLQPNLGTASQFVLMRAAGAVAGGLCGLLCMYVTYAANGASYAPTPTKAAVMVTLLSCLSFVFSLYRFRYPRYWFAFTVATFSMPMVALNPFHQDYVEWRALFYWWLQAALGVGAAAAAAALVFPVTAGRKVRLKTAEALRQLAALTAAAVQYAASAPLGKDGMAAGASGLLDGREAVDTGLCDAVRPLLDAAAAIGANLTQTRTLLGVVGAEWNVYAEAHTFPREAYEILLHINRAALSSLTALLYPLQSGRLALRAVHTMQREFCAAADLLAACLSAAADCVDRGAPYGEALGALRAMEARWQALGGLCPRLHSSWGEAEVLSSDMLVATLFTLGTRARRVFFTLPEALRGRQPEARQACARHFHGGPAWDLAQPQEQLRERARRRAATPTVAGMAPGSALPSPCDPANLPSPRPGLPSPRQNETPVPALQLPPSLLGEQQQQAASPRLMQRVTEERQAQARGWLPRHSPAPAVTPKQAAAEHAPPLEPSCWHPLPALGVPCGGTGIPAGSLQCGSTPPPAEEPLWQPPDAATVAQRFPPVIRLPKRPPQGRLSAALAAAAGRTGFSGEHAALALQLAVAMAAACTLHVCQASYSALRERTIWIVVTVCVVLESAVGGLVLKSGLRVAGTAAAGLLGMGMLGFAVLCNGGGYANRPPKFIAMSALLPVALALLMLNHVRYAAPYGYALSCAKFTTPIVALAGYLADSVQWATAGWRLLNILLGIGLDLAAATLVLPVTSRAATRRRVQEVLGGLAELAEAVLAQFIQGQQAKQPTQPTLAHGSAASSPHGPSSRKAAASGGGSAAATSRGVGRRARLPTTPLSSSEAAELAVAALWQEGEDRRETSLEGRRWQTSPGASRRGSASLSLEVEGVPRGVETPPSVRRRLARFLARLPSPAAAAGCTAADVESGALLAAAADGWVGGPAAKPPSSPGGSLFEVVLAAPAGDPASLPQEGGSSPPAAQPESPLTGRMGTPPQPPPLAHSKAAGAGDGCAPPPPPPLALDGPEAPLQRGGATSPQATPASPLGLAGAAPAAAPPSVLRRGASLPPDLPTVVSQQVFAAEELPSLPPLHIPPHHQPWGGSDGEEASGRGGTTRRSGSDELGTPAGRWTGAQAAGNPRLQRRPSASSTAFYAGTPRDRLARRRRSHWLRERALGRPVMAVHALGSELAATIAHMAELALFARFEWDPCASPHRMKPKDILAVQATLRKLLSVLLSLPYLADATDVPHTRLLLPHPAEVQGVAQQLGEALRALGLVLDGGMEVEGALAMVRNTQLQVQLLLLEVEQDAPPAGASQADAVLAVAALGIMFSATQTVQLLYRCVLRMLGTPEQAAAAESAFAQSAAWGASVEAILVARGVVVASLAGGGEEDGEARAQARADEDAAALGLGRGD